MSTRARLLRVVVVGVVVGLGSFAMTSAGATVQAGPAATLADTAPIQGNGLVAFASDRSGNQDVYTMYLDGQGVTDVTNDPGSDTDPAWSKDGTKLAFVS